MPPLESKTARRRAHRETAARRWAARRPRPCLHLSEKSGDSVTAVEGIGSVLWGTATLAPLLSSPHVMVASGATVMLLCCNQDDRPISSKSTDRYQSTTCVSQSATKI